VQIQKSADSSHNCQLSTALFLRALAAIYAIAFLSLWTQVSGLIGHNGILPAHYYLEVARRQLGAEAFWLLPTLGWLNASDAFWQGVCICGALLGLLGLAGLGSAATYFLMWAFYLSLVIAGRDFMGFQWDALLLEAGFLAIFLSSLRLLPKLGLCPSPSGICLWLGRWLLFRLMFSSGVVKLVSGDPTWLDLSALNYHYETQPLPNALSWFMHQLPRSFQRSSVAAMFVVELLLPFFVFGPRRLRLVAWVGFVMLQVLILITGNYAFFNLLTLALCVLLLDDSILSWLDFSRATRNRGEVVGGNRWPAWILAPVAVALSLSSMVALTDTLRWQVNWPSPVARVVQWLGPFNITNRYGLFAVMTTERPEIVLEGSLDGEHWQAYEFAYKPGDLARRPPFVAPHQPRLDWQMWFAALGQYQDNPWFGSLCKRLLQGKPEVLQLLAGNPFPDKPPRYVRGVLYDYHFTDFTKKRSSGRWWRREPRGLYSPVMSLPENSR